MSENLFDNIKYKIIDNKIKGLDDEIIFLEQVYYKNSEKIKHILCIYQLKGNKSSRKSFGWKIDPFTKIKTFS